MPRKKKKNKEQKPKVVYYDDNSPIADMSQVGNSIGFNKNARQQNNVQQHKQQPKRKSTAKEKWNTYWSSVKLMFLPMIGVLIILLVLYLFLMLISGGFNR